MISDLEWRERLTSSVRSGISVDAMRAERGNEKACGGGGDVCYRCGVRYRGDVLYREVSLESVGRLKDEKLTQMYKYC